MRWSAGPHRRGSVWKWDSAGRRRQNKERHLITTIIIIITMTRRKQKRLKVMNQSFPDSDWNIGPIETAEDRCVWCFGTFGTCLRFAVCPPDPDTGVRHSLHYAVKRVVHSFLLAFSGERW
jgi:hypothetical protein